MKQQLLEALQRLPEGVTEFLDTAIPELQTFEKPTNEESATIAQGILAYNLNKILVAFVGFTPLPFLLRAGQHNPVYQGILLASLQAFAKPSAVHIDAPLADGQYYGVFLDWQVSVTVQEEDELVSLIGNLDGEEFELTSGTGDFFTAEWPCPTGDHLFEAVATFADEQTERASVAFRVASWSEMPTVPANGETMAVQAESDISIQAFPGASATAISKMAVTSGKYSYEMLFDEEKGVYSAALLSPSDIWDFVNEAQIRSFEIIVTAVNAVSETIASFRLQPPDMTNAPEATP